ncbi:MAG: glycosyltransferase [Candidatus Aureabacteria bacterium]|nr:glycosyltransferase [Candidatus Auribacterota bacterium]
MPIRVLYVIDKMVRAGAQRHLRQVVAGLSRPEFEPSLCCLLETGPLGEELKAGGLAVDTLGFRNVAGPRFLPAAFALARLARRRKADVLHAYLFAANIVSPLAGLLSGTPAITSRRDMGFWQRRRHVWANRLGNLITSRITVNSLGVRDYVLNREKASASRVVLIHNGIDPGEIGAPSARTIAPGRRIVIGALGNLRPVKGYDHLLQALALLIEEGRDCELRIGGRVIDADYDRALRARAAAPGLAGRVVFSGEIAAVPDFLRTLDVFVLPSLSEGFPNALLEAMALGLPVVATAVGANPEVIRDGVDGFLVPPADPGALARRIGDLGAHPALSAALGRSARERVREEFSAARMCRSLENLYREVVKRNFE